MISVNLKDVLRGRIKYLPGKMEPDELVDFAMSLTVALAALRDTEFPEMVELDNDSQPPTTKEWDEITESYINFFLNNQNQFDPGVIIHAVTQALRIFDIRINSETDSWMKFYDTFADWIVGYEPAGTKVYVGDGKYADYDSWRKNAKKDESNYCGGHFSLREHHLPKKDDS
jgi:hypothetical protein